MDDDVAVMPEGIERWQSGPIGFDDSLHDDGGPFYWQYDVPLGIPKPDRPLRSARLATE